MAYKYETERPKIFTEQGVKMLSEIRDQAREHLQNSGAFQGGHIRVSGDGWLLLACLDYMKECGEIIETTGPDVWGQHRTYIRGSLRL